MMFVEDFVRQFFILWMVTRGKNICQNRPFRKTIKAVITIKATLNMQMEKAKQGAMLLYIGERRSDIRLKGLK